MQTPQQTNILSWNGVKLAKGYERVVLTWQGVYWEVAWQDVVFKNLTEKVRTEPGMRKWVTKGATVYQFEKGYKHILNKHRFAVIPSGNEKVCREEIRANRCYIHIYQTRVHRSESDVRWLKSKEMAKFLYKTWSQSYFPRPRDIWKKPARAGMRGSTRRKDSSLTQIKYPGRSWGTRYGESNKSTLKGSRALTDTMRGRSWKNHRSTTYNREERWKKDIKNDVHRATNQFREDIEQFSNIFQKICADFRNINQICKHF